MPIPIRLASKIPARAAQKLVVVEKKILIMPVFIAENRANSPLPPAA